MAPSSDSRCHPFLTNRGTLLSSAFVRVARRYVVSGRVQGVGFRFFARETALRENLHGWVRNLANGSVEAAVEGEADAVEHFEQALRHGPRGARVEQLTIEHTVPDERDTGFAIR